MTRVLLLLRSGSAIFFITEALELAIKDANWDALEFMVDLDQTQAQHSLNRLVFVEATNGNEEVVMKLIESGASPTKALAAAAYKNNKKLAARVIELGADVHQALYEIEGNVEAGKFLIERGSDANLALLGFASKHRYNDAWEEIAADKLIDVFGADPLLVSMYVGENTGGFAYLSARYVRFTKIDLAGGYVEKIGTRSMFIEKTEQLSTKLEFLTPSEARRLIEEGANVNLALLYLARNKDKKMAKYLINKFGANPAAVASLAQAGGEEDTATFLRELAE